MGRCCPSGTRKSHVVSQKEIAKSEPEAGEGRPQPAVEKTVITEVNSVTRTRPFTGQEYIESLRDGREIWIYGERVKDVTTHPAFRNTVRMLARLYDALHDEQRKSILCTETDTGSGGYTHKFFQASRTTRKKWWARATPSRNGRA